MLDQLSERLQTVFSGMDSRGKNLTEEDIDSAIREVRRAFLEADVNLRVIKAFMARLKERAVGAEILKGLNPGQQLVGIVHEELIALLGQDTVPLNSEGTVENPAIILLFGLQGSGKTTSCGKLALKLKKEGKKPLLVAADIYRPAAIKQLQDLGGQIQVPVHTLDGSTDMLAIAQTGLDKGKADGHDVIIIDTAGRLQVDTDMMAELLTLDRMVQPQEKLLVIDAMMGQEAVGVAEAFHTQIAMSGIIITKLDGDARGGAVLSVVETTGQPIKFIGTSETLSGLDVFHPERMASRILGMGDVLSLVEKAQQAVDIEEAKAMEKKFRKQSFSLNDFLNLQRQISKLGSFEQILGMLPIPGMTKDMKEMLAHGGQSSLKRIESMIQSMTAEERENPDIIRESRVKRIAKGSGMEDQEVERFLQSFETMKLMMKQLTGMTGGGDDEKAAEVHAGNRLAMPRSGKKKKKNKGLKLPGMGNMPGGMPNMPGGMPNLPGGMPNMPDGFPGGKFPF